MIHKEKETETGVKVGFFIGDQEPYKKLKSKDHNAVQVRQALSKAMSESNWAKMRESKQS